MSETRRKYDPEFREGAVRIVKETGKPIAHIAEDLGLHPGTLGNWVKKDRIERGKDQGLDPDDRARLNRLEREPSHQHSGRATSALTTNVRAGGLCGGS